jgi:hypothetical protein
MQLIYVVIYRMWNDKVEVMLHFSLVSGLIVVSDNPLEQMKFASDIHYTHIYIYYV